MIRAWLKNHRRQKQKLLTLQFKATQRELKTSLDRDKLNRMIRRREHHKEYTR